MMIGGETNTFSVPEGVEFPQSFYLRGAVWGIQMRLNEEEDSKGPASRWRPVSDLIDMDTEVWRYLLQHICTNDSWTCMLHN